MLLSINYAASADGWLMLLIFGFVFLLFVVGIGFVVVAVFKGIDKIGKES